MKIVFKINNSVRWNMNMYLVIFELIVLWLELIDFKLVVLVIIYFELDSCLIKLGDIFVVI